MRVVVLLPTYNAAENITAALYHVRSAVPDGGMLVVDVTDAEGTADLAEVTARNIGGDIQVLRREGKAGLGSAYRAGFALAMDQGAEVLVEMDADLSHAPTDLPALLAAVEHGADLAIGSRYVPGGKIPNWSWHRKMLSRWGNRYAAGVLGLAVNDATAGYRAYRSDALRRVDFGSVTAEGYGFQIEMTHRVVRAGGKVVEFPIRFRDRGAGESKMTRGIVREAFTLVGTLWLVDRRDRRRRRRLSG